MDRFKKHRWDESLTIAVMVVAALGILIMLATHISVTGHAVATQSLAEDMLGQASIISGEGKTRCNVACAKQKDESCILAWANEKLTTCNAKISGKYQCVCAIPGKVTPN